MANTTTSANMMLPVPIVGVDPGPQYASDINSCLSIIDSHDHAAGSGVKVTPNGMNISSDLSFGGNNATQLRSTRLATQLSSLVTASDKGCLSNINGNLFYNDGVSGTPVQITSGTAIVGTPGSIANLVSPASASYVAGTLTFVWQSNSNTSANMDSGPLIIRNLTTSSHGLTLQAPTLSGDYTLTLPTIPGAQKIMSLDASGNISAPYTVDGTTIAISSNVIGVPNSGINTAQIAPDAITGTQMATGSVSNVNIVDATITGSKLVASTITRDQIAAATIIGGNIAATTITGSNLVNNTITATQIANATVTGTQIATSVALNGKAVTVAGSYPLVAAENPISFVRGNFNGTTGAIVVGGGFTVSVTLNAPTNIIYTVTFTTAFGGAPTCSAFSQADAQFFTVASTSTTTAVLRLWTRDVGGTLVLDIVDFIAIGPRA